MIKGGYMAFPSTANQKYMPYSRGSGINIGCFNHSRKLTRKSIDLFSNTVQSIEEKSKLVLKSISFADKEEQRRIESDFISAGLSDRTVETSAMFKHS